MITIWSFLSWLEQPPESFVHLRDRMPRPGGALGADALHEQSSRRTSERAHDDIELGLELRDSCELNAQLPFGIGKSLVDGPERFDGGSASNRGRSREWRRGRKCTSSHGKLLRSPRAYARGENARCAEPNTEPTCLMSGRNWIEAAVRRQVLITNEANAIGTAYLRIDLFQRHSMQ